MFTTPPEPRAWLANDRIQLVILSVLSLFVEIMLIRHLGSEIRIFAYFKNLTLIGAFLGLGFGYLYKPRINLLVSLVAIGALALVTHPSSGFSTISTHLSLSDLNTWEYASAQGFAFNLTVGVLMLLLIFFLVIVAMVPVGQGLSVLFDRSTNRIVDYSVNIAASIAGIWLFAFLSFAWTPPVFWYVGVYLLALLIWRWDARATAVIAGLMLLTGVSLDAAGRQPGMTSFWSPYQLITFQTMEVSAWKEGRYGPTGYTFHSIGTNNTFYLNLFDLGPAARAEHPEFSPPTDNVFAYYDLPYRLADKLDHVLVLGAGGGNDVAAALRAGAKKVTAVEIDPVIIKLGTEHHPEHPYTDPRVTVVNNDARNFLKTTDQKFDLIVLGLLDSHTLTSSFTNTNLDSFMYTLESVADMKSRLTDHGVVSLSFFITYPWIGAKIDRMMAAQFGAPPAVVSFQLAAGTRSGTSFLASPDRKRLEERVAAYLEQAPELKEATRAAQAGYGAIEAEAQTDDWPYMYVRDRAVPKLHLLVSGLLALIFVVMYGVFFGRPGRSDLHFAALGAGFLLLEVGVISRFALFWGSTWLVSSIVITLILLAILAANTLYLKRRKKIGYPALYGALLLTLGGLYLLPLTSNLMAILYLVPFTLIGYLFARSFDEAESAGRALGYNLLGALVGGLAESASFVTGLSALILIAAGFYLLSAIALRRS
ncbi:MAG: methyltransferase domain-containing protein [Nitrospinae bacterium]|nr:methyltransferase domain-containing protein [Nitrospinota bacterium]